MNSLDELISSTPLDPFFDQQIKNRIRVCRYISGAKIRLTEGILFLLKGTVSFAYGDEEGHPYHMVISRAFNSVGELKYFHNRTIFDIYALEDSIVIEIPNDLMPILLEDDEFNIFILKLANQNLMDLADKMLKKNLYKLENYLAYIINTDQYKGKYHYKSMTSLASIINVSRRNLYYAADSLVDQGIISKGKGYFEIKNAEELKRLI